MAGAGLDQYLTSRLSRASFEETALHDPSSQHGPSFGTMDEFLHAVEELKALLPDEKMVSTDPADALAHGSTVYDYHPDSSHACVVYPQKTEDVVTIVKIANKYRMPIVAYSGGTSLEGQFRSISDGGSICIDMSDMDRILEIHEDDFDVVCQPGIGWMDLNAILADQGIPLFFPLDPAPQATIGGMISNGCSGTNAVRYGTARGEWFLNVTVVLPSGDVVKTRRRARKSSVGFDTTQLFIGAEGTLGIITEVTLRLAPVLPTTVAVVHFPDVKKAVEAVGSVLKRGVGIQCVELCDNDFMRITNIHGTASHKYPERDSLYFKFQGATPLVLAETARIVQETVERHGGFGFQLAPDETSAADLWSDRKNAFNNALAANPGAKAISTDVCVPISRLPDLVYDVKRDFTELGITSFIVGHAGDGNFHAAVFFKNEDEYSAGQEAVDRMVKRAIALDGTCTGEHGVGIGKRKYLREELGDETIALMRTIKRAIDPHGLFNPGKLYPDEKKAETAPAR